MYIAVKPNMKKPFLLFVISSSLCFSICTKHLLAVDSDNLQDTCPANTSKQRTVFINGFPCKNPANIAASDFKTSLLNHTGDTDNFLGSSTTIARAENFPGLNTLGLSAARTDLAVDGLVLPHSHPRASEMVFVSKGVVNVGFIDTKNQLFQMVLREGEVFVFPRGLLHYCLNTGFGVATVFSVLNSQNPGVVTVADAMFAPNDSEAMRTLTRRLISLSKVEADRVENVYLFEF